MSLNLKRTDGGNGHRRRQLRARVIAEETHCALCGGLVDKNLKHQPGSHRTTCQATDCGGCNPHPLRAEVDEDLPRSRGGSPLDSDNVALMHRICNERKGKMTLAEARVKLAGTPPQAHTYASDGW